MEISYKKLWVRLIQKDNQTVLHKDVGLSTGAMSKRNGDRKLR